MTLDWSDAYRAHERHLFALCYRLTGSTADAADLVQETFARLIERAPADRERDLRPWLVRVAVNLARDQYRARRRRAYVGPWLPSPVDTEAAPWLAAESSAEARYAAQESVNLAFLVALEALSPNERAVLVLRDVVDHDVKETAELVGISEANVRTIHLRARRKMAAHDRDRADRAAADGEKAALMQFSMALAAGDPQALTALLTADARARTDGGGVVRAALREVIGADKIARFFLGLLRKTGGADVAASLREINGQTALVVNMPTHRPRWAERFVLMLDAAADGRIRRLWVMMVPEKLRQL